MSRGPKYALGLLLTAQALGLAGLERSTREDESDLYAKLSNHAQRGGPEAAEFMIQALGKGGWMDRDKITCLAAFGDSRAIEPLCAILQFRSPLSAEAANRGAAADALGRFRDPRSREALQQAVRADPVWGVYRAAKLALYELERDSFVISNIPLLSERLRNAVEREPIPPDGVAERVRRNDAMLKSFQITSGQCRWLHPDDFISDDERVRAEKTLLRLVDGRDPECQTEVVERLMEYAVAAKISSSIKDRAAALIRRIGRPAVPALLNGLRRGDDSLQWVCAKRLADIGDERAIQPLEAYAATFDNDWQAKRASELCRTLQATAARNR